MSCKICRSGYCDRTFKFEPFSKPLDGRLRKFFEVSGRDREPGFFIYYSVRGLDGASEIN
jgi:hypothetical protein